MARVNSFTDMADVALVMEVRDAFKGMRICISGHLGRKRDDIVQIIEMGGGTFHNKIVRWSTTHLLTNADWSKNSVEGGKSSKYREAMSAGVKMLSEQEFYDMLCRAEATE